MTLEVGIKLLLKLIVNLLSNKKRLETREDQEQT